MLHDANTSRWVILLSFLRALPTLPRAVWTQRREILAALRQR